VDESEPAIPHHAAALHSSYTAVRDNLQTFLDQIGAVREEISQLISAMQPAYFAESYRLHDEEMINDSDEHILNRVPVLQEEVQQYIKSRIQVRSDWKHAGLIIRPGNGEWLPLLVGCDPLYLADIRPSLLETAVEQFTPEYRRRVLKYSLKEADPDGRVLGNIPDSQFGFCLALNFFHYKPFELIRYYLLDIYRKLKPGGIMAMTFNDCDRAGGVDLVERHFMCYTPGTMLLALAENCGFVIQQKYRIDNCNTWLEMQKPGTLVSLRGGQSLAKIVANH
jgi:SAM-dependent methyltransferase